MRARQNLHALLSQASDDPEILAMKVAGESLTAFVVEAVAASQVRDVAQQVGSWQGRVFLPMLQAVGLGQILDDPPQEASRNASVLVMQVAEGTLQAKRFEGEALIMVAWALASTLALLNEAGFIHGDLKPANVLWQSDSDVQTKPTASNPCGWPLLTDFGSAQSFSTMHPNQEPLSLNDQIQTHGWTRAYAAPEVVDCNGKLQSIRSDMYSWALTIRAASWEPKLPLGLQELCDACLSINPESRPVSFMEIANVLEKKCPACLRWGQALWDQQQKRFASAGDAQQHIANVCAQGLKVLVSQRQHLSADPEARSDALGLLANQHLRIGNASDAVLLYQEAVQVNPERAASSALLTNLGSAYGDLGDAAKMRDLLERALRIMEAYYGKDHIEVAKTLFNLGNAYGGLGDAAKMRDLLERALRIIEAYYGKDHIEVAKTLNNLGSAYGDLGDAGKKRDLLERALRIKEAYYGKDHIEVAITLYNLGSAYGDLGDAAKMRDLLERALRMVEAYYGKDHIEVAKTLNNLGNAYGDLGDAGKKRDLLERALRIKEAYYGKDHIEVAKTLNNLGSAYGDLGDAGKMRDLLERALRIIEAYYGKDHIEVAKTLNNLGGAYGDLGDAGKKRDLLERALRIIEAYYGKDHIEVAKTLNNLGSAYGDLGDAAKMRDLLERALRIVEAYYGKDHIEVAKTLNNLGNAYGDLGDAGKKRDLLERALRIIEAYYGKDHIEVAKTLNNLGSAHGDLGDAAKMRDLLERALRIKEAYYGKDHIEVAVTLNNLGSAHGDLGDAAKKRDLLERALRIIEAYYGKDHIEVAKTLNNLGSAHGDLGDAAKMRDLLERALRIKEAYYGKDHIEVAVTLFNLAAGPVHILEGFEAAKGTCERCLRIFLASLGPGHPHTMKVHRHLGGTLHKYEAEQFCMHQANHTEKCCEVIIWSKFGGFQSY